MLCLFKISNPNNLILVIITFTFIPLVGVAVNVAAFFLELLLLKEVLKHQVNCDRVQWVASCRSDLIQSVGLEVKNLWKTSDVLLFVCCQHKM